MKHNKQHDARAASFKRIAKGLRTDARQSRKDHNAVMAAVLTLVAARIEAEAVLLRSMR